MSSKDSLEYKDDYVQSANIFFHFMKEEIFLTKALDKCALMPRYCKENIEYMHLENPDGNLVKEMVVLQKCFCDIPFHKIKEKFPVDILNESELTDEVRSKVYESGFYTHTGCYGEYGIAFSKAWCVVHGLQPVLYVNKESDYLQQLRKLYTHLMAEDDPDEVYIQDLLRQYAYLKPLQGVMNRQIDGASVELQKNFHDEKEWRFIPGEELLSEGHLSKVAFRRVVIDNYVDISNNIEAPTYNSIWLKFTYDDIKYLIVPDRIAGKRIISFILNMPTERFVDEMQRSVLISKIQVLEDIRKDW